MAAKLVELACQSSGEKAMSSYRETRDQRIANDHTQDSALMCRATGCPNRWSVTAENGMCCSWHAWAAPHYWPQITQEQLDAAADRALKKAAEQYQPQPIPDVRRLRAVLTKLGEGMRGATQNPKRWAWLLKAREERGEKLNDHQAKAWREALQYRAPDDMEQAA